MSGRVRVEYNATEPRGLADKLLAIADTEQSQRKPSRIGGKRASAATTRGKCGRSFDRNFGKPGEGNQ